MNQLEYSRRLEKLAGMSAAKFVVHRPPMLLLDRLVEIAPEYAVCEWRVQEEHAFLIPGRGVPAYIGVEYMAQCNAVHAGARERALGLSPQLGLLLGTRHFKADVHYFEVNSTYQVECRELARSTEGMASFECQIFLNGKTIVKARIAVLQKQHGN